VGGVGKAALQLLLLQGVPPYSYPHLPPCQNCSQPCPPYNYYHHHLLVVLLLLLLLLL